MEEDYELRRLREKRERLEREKADLVKTKQKKDMIESEKRRIRQLEKEVNELNPPPMGFMEKLAKGSERVLKGTKEGSGDV